MALATGSPLIIALESALSLLCLLRITIMTSAWLALSCLAAARCWRFCNAQPWEGLPMDERLAKGT